MDKLLDLCLKYELDERARNDRDVSCECRVRRMGRMTLVTVSVDGSEIASERDREPYKAIDRAYGLLREFVDNVDALVLSVEAVRAMDRGGQR